MPLTGSPTVEHGERRAPAPSHTPVRVLAVADSDSYLKWGATTLDALPSSFDRQVVLLDSPICPTAPQVDAALAGTQFAASDVPTVAVTRLPGLLRSWAPDVVLLAATGPMAELAAEIAVRSATRPALVSGIPGMALPATLRALRFRARCDVFITHSARERTEYRANVDALGLDTVVALSPLPFLPAAPGGPMLPLRRVVFAPQAKVPAARVQRERILVALEALARRRPDVDVVVKLRAVAGERQTHNEALPYDDLWADLVREQRVGGGSVRFATGPLADQLGAGTALTTVSSTAALESIAAGLPTLVLEDFGVNERMLNAVFASSGCLGTLDDLIDARFSCASPEWTASNYLHDDASELPELFERLTLERRTCGLPDTSVRASAALGRRQRRLVRTAARAVLPGWLLAAGSAIRHPLRAVRPGVR